MLMFIKGRVRPETDNPLNRALIAAYRPTLVWVLRRPKLTLGIAAAALALTFIPASQLGGEFMPPMNEGDILYMPTALPGLSASKASQLLQVTGRIIKTVPEVKTVFGKAGRADTATDPAPLEMFETLIQRSEEHTSELQSLMRLSYAVFCLKKKNTYRRSCIMRLDI